MASKQYTIRAVPVQVDRALRRLARESGKSLNQVALEALAKEAGQIEEPKRFDDLNGLIGSWVDEPGFDEAMASFEQIDESLWR